MLSWFQALMPKEERFFRLFADHAATLVAGAAALRDLLEGGDGAAAACDRIMLHENQADDITREVMLAVRRTFITPFDRGDIQNLVTSLDDAIDQMQKTAKATQLFEITQFEPPMRQMGDIIVEAAKRSGTLGHAHSSGAPSRQATRPSTVSQSGCLFRQ